MTRLESRSQGAELAMLLLSGFHTMTDEVITQLESRGYKGVRPVHAFAIEAIDTGADTASELGRRLSTSKQAAAKTIAVLEQMGYVDRVSDPNDARRKKLQVTPRGCEVMVAGGTLFTDVRRRWAAQIGEREMEALEAHLSQITRRREMGADDLARFDGDQDEIV